MNDSKYLTYDEMTDEQRRSIVKLVTKNEWGFKDSDGDSIAVHADLILVERPKPKPKRYIVELREPREGERWVSAFGGTHRSVALIDSFVPKYERAVIVEEL